MKGNAFSQWFDPCLGPAPGCSLLCDEMSGLVQGQRDAGEERRGLAQ